MILNKIDMIEIEITCVIPHCCHSYIQYIYKKIKSSYLIGL